MADPPAQALPAGTILGRSGDYRVNGVLGAGRYGIVYSATAQRPLLEDPAADGEVAIKELFPRIPGLACERHGTGVVVPQGLRGYFDELRAGLTAEWFRQTQAAHVGGVATALDSFDENGTSYIVMERIRGASIREVLAAGGFEPGAAEPFVDRLCDVVHRLHTEWHLVHNDLNIANVFRRESDGQPVVLDLGLARRIGDPQPQLVGTGPEAPPREEFVDPASDVYRLGVLVGQIYANDARAEPVVTGQLDDRMPEHVQRAVRGALTGIDGRRTRSVVEFRAHLRRDPSVNDQPPSAPDPDPLSAYATVPPAPPPPDPHKGTAAPPVPPPGQPNPPRWGLAIGAILASLLLLAAVAGAAEFISGNDDPDDDIALPTTTRSPATTGSPGSTDTGPAEPGTETIPEDEPYPLASPTPSKAELDEALPSVPELAKIVSVQDQSSIREGESSNHRYNAPLTGFWTPEPDVCGQTTTFVAAASAERMVNAYDGSRGGPKGAASELATFASEEEAERVKRLALRLNQDCDGRNVVAADVPGAAPESFQSSWVDDDQAVTMVFFRKGNVLAQVSARASLDLRSSVDQQTRAVAGALAARIPA